jgi:hypothetical protein
LPRRERDVQESFRRIARRLGIVTRKTTWTQFRGAPDLLLLGPGRRHGFVEVKREGGQLTPLQLREILRLRAAGFFVAVCSGDRDVERVLTAYLTH